MDRIADANAFDEWNGGSERFRSIRLQAWLAALDWERSRKDGSGFGVGSHARQEMLKSRHSDSSLAHQIAMVERPLAPGEHQQDR